MLGADARLLAGRRANKAGGGESGVDDEDDGDDGEQAGACGLPWGWIRSVLLPAMRTALQPPRDGEGLISPLLSHNIRRGEGEAAGRRCWWQRGVGCKEGEGEGVTNDRMKPSAKAAQPRSSGPV